VRVAALDEFEVISLAIAPRRAHQRGWRTDF
jgi:hypothetical protein